MSLHQLRCLPRHHGPSRYAGDIQLVVSSCNHTTRKSACPHARVLAAANRVELVLLEITGSSFDPIDGFGRVQIRTLCVYDHDRDGIFSWMDFDGADWSRKVKVGVEPPSPSADKLSRYRVHKNNLAGTRWHRNIETVQPSRRVIPGQTVGVEFSTGLPSRRGRALL